MQVFTLAFLIAMRMYLMFQKVPKFSLMICWLLDGIFSHYLFAMGSFCDIFQREVHAISIDISHIYIMLKSN